MNEWSWVLIALGLIAWSQYRSLPVAGGERTSAIGMDLIGAGASSVYYQYPASMQIL